MKRWIAQVAAEHGYRDIEDVLEVTGTCRVCTRRAGTNAVPAGPSAQSTRCAPEALEMIRGPERVTGYPV